MFVDETWLPTEANVEALPEPIRRYVLALEADRDPDGMVRANALLRDQLDETAARLRELHDRLCQIAVFAGERV